MSNLDNPGDLSLNTYLMSPPFKNSFDNKVPNNPLMNKEDKPNYELAFKQWLNLYRYLCENGMVYILPNEGTFQDRVYTANGGIVLHHQDEPIFIASNFTSKPRRGEEEAYITFMSQLGYKVFRSPFRFEGEADLKYIRGKGREALYVGGAGIRSEAKTFQWLSEKFPCNIITIEMNDKKLYHEDCILFPLDEETVLLNSSVVDDSDIIKLEQYVKIIDVPSAYKYTGITNLVRVDDVIICRDLDPSPKSWLSKIMADHGFSVKYFNVSAYNVGGADTSCLILSITKQNLKPGKSIVAGLRQFLKK